MNYRIPFIFTILAAFSCSKQESAKVITPTITDHIAPKFITPPQTRSITHSSVDIITSLDENGTVIATLSDQENFHLTTPELLALDKQDPHLIKLSLAAHHHKTVHFEQLTPNQRYKVLLVAVDENGNEQPQPTILQFTTLGTNNAVTFINEAPSARQGIPWFFKPQLDRTINNIALVDAPVWLQWEDKNFLVTGIPDAESYGQHQFTFTLVVKEPGYEGSRTYTVPMNGDPLAAYAWHLENRGQTSFAWFGGKPGIDINLNPAMIEGLTGKGIKIRIVDSGLQMNHPDLVTNINAADSFNFASWNPHGCTICDPNDPSPLPVPGAPGDHGTSVAGIAGAMGWNDIGSRGVAPDVELSGMNLLSPEVEPTDEHFIYQLNGDVDIVNQSFGANTKGLEKNLQLDSLYDSTMETNVIRGRNGKGIIYVKAAGNGFDIREDANFDPVNTTPWTIVVGAVNALGEKASYSTPGSNLWISAPAGEYGFQSEYTRLTDISLPKLSFTPAIITTDFTSSEFPCQWGFSKRPNFFYEENKNLESPYLLFSLGQSSGFNMGWNALNPTCDYTATMNGTSAATPIISGVVALLMQKNPYLTWRDIKHILATTARKIDAERDEESTTINGHRFVRTQSWKTNAAGYAFHNWYGFGLVDVGAALKMADPATYQPLPDYHYTDWESAGNVETIPTNDPWGILQDFTQRDKHLIAETVQIKINIHHLDMSHIGLILESPSGTTSILLPPQNGAYYKDFQEMVFSSQAFYNEGVEGVWKLNVVDGKGGIETNGQLISWSIRFLGHY